MSRTLEGLQAVGWGAFDARLSSHSGVEAELTGRPGIADSGHPLLFNHFIRAGEQSLWDGEA